MTIDRCTGILAELQTELQMKWLFETCVFFTFVDAVAIDGQCARLLNCENFTTRNARVSMLCLTTLTSFVQSYRQDVALSASKVRKVNFSHCTAVFELTVGPHLS